MANCITDDNADRFARVINILARECRDRGPGIAITQN